MFIFFFFSYNCDETRSLHRIKGKSNSISNCVHICVIWSKFKAFVYTFYNGFYSLHRFWTRLFCILLLLLLLLLLYLFRVPSAARRHNDQDEMITTKCSPTKSNHPHPKILNVWQFDSEMCFARRAFATNYANAMQSISPYSFRWVTLCFVSFQFISFYIGHHVLLLVESIFCFTRSFCQQSIYCQTPK